MGLIEPETEISSLYLGLPVLMIAMVMAIAGLIYSKRVFSKKQPRDLEARLTASYV
jgi:hypothetical protein